MATNKTLTLGLFLLSFAIFFAYVSACSTDEAEPPGVTDPTISGGPHEGSWANAVAVVRALPIFPGAQLSNGQPVVGEYPDGGPVAPSTTGFYVPPGTTVDDVTSFFAEALPKVGWQEEETPWIYGGEKEGSVVQTVIYSFLHPGDGLRLAIQIPLIHKDAPDGVRVVALVVVPKEEDILGSPIATSTDYSIDDTPPPIQAANSDTPTFTPPAIQAANSDTPTVTAPPIQTGPALTFGAGTPTAAP
jgi:hypothetical protein